MKELKQLYTDIFRGSSISSRKLIFIAEGYRTVDESIFHKDVYDLLKSLETIFPDRADLHLKSAPSGGAQEP